MVLSSSHGDGHGRVRAHVHVHVDAHDHGDAPNHDVLDAHGVHDTLVHGHRPQTLVADSDRLLVHVAHTSRSQLRVGVAVLNIADTGSSRFVDVDIGKKMAY